MESIDCNDIHTLSNPLEVVVKHSNFDLEINFQTKTISGKITHQIENLTGCQTLILDTRGLTIQKVLLDETEPASFALGPEQNSLGKPLEITINKKTSSVSIFYSTSPESPALQWLTPEQTSGKKHPLLFTLSQPIFARCWFPCQDTPGVRFTYTADIRVPKDMLALMSAENPREKNPDGLYHFQMNQPVPSYLVALATGNFCYEAVDARTGVYAEPQIIGKALWELADMGKMLDAAEELCGDYRWGQFDVLVLPQAFPLNMTGNPRLSYITPTILSGDRSLTYILALAMAHSWPGSLVTVANWSEIWLNEAFALYIERRLIEKLDGKSFADILAVSGYQDLHQEFKNIGYSSDHTQLKSNSPSRLPNEDYALIIREKGYLFLLKIEKIIGREHWDAFLKGYFNELAFHPVTTDIFIEYFERQVITGDKKTEDQLGLFKWIFESGLPSNCPMPKSIRLFNVSQLIFQWKNGTPLSELNTKKWSTHEWMHFLRHLPANLTPDQLSDLDETFGFSFTLNPKILAAWLLIAINNGYKNCYALTEHFLTTVGRSKFIIPLYKALMASEEGRVFAKEIYKKTRPDYLYANTSVLDNILEFSV